ncbi:MAG: glycosyl transferase family 1 [Deltaproteobacteria bacterium]|nr:glycosyl transferase family 1 [Deltaproteobacteria bacterium]
MSKIIIISGNHLCNNPRVLKEADVLSEAGYEVEVLGAIIDKTLKTRDQNLMSIRKWTFIPVLDLTSSQVNNYFYRIRKRFGSTLFTFFGIENRWQLGYVTTNLLRVAIKRKADLYISHLEQAMWVASQLYDRGLNVGIDMEDWYSEDLEEIARIKRPAKMLRKLEQQLLASCNHVTCTSQVMAEALSRRYNCKTPTVIYNTFSLEEGNHLDSKIIDRKNTDLPSVYWFSQTLGPSRGLEDLFSALPLLKNRVEIHLRGKPIPEWKKWLETQVTGDWLNYIYIHPPVTNTELLSRAAEHDIGFAGEMKYCLNKNLTASNKIFHYLLAGLCVIASNTDGQVEISLKAPAAFQIYTSGDSNALANVINNFMYNPTLLIAAKKAALIAARKHYNWENEKEKLINSAKAAL